MSKSRNYCVIADNFYESGELERAIEFYNKALSFEKREGKIPILMELALISDELDDSIGAMGYFDAILAIDASESRAHYGRGMIYEKEGNVVKAEAAYLKAIELDPNYDRAFFFLANLYDVNDRQDEAIVNYQRTIELTPDDFMAHNNLGCIFEDRKAYAIAQKLFEQSIALEPEYFRSQFNLGVVYKALGKLDEALAQYRLAQELNPHYADVYLNMSALHIEREDFQASIGDLDEGISYIPDAAYLYYNRACSKIRLNRIDEGFLDLEVSFKLDPDLIDYAQEDPDFKSVRMTEGFIALMKE